MQLWLYREISRGIRNMTPMQAVRIYRHDDISVAFAPNDSPLMLRDAGTRDIYSLEREEP